MRRQGNAADLQVCRMLVSVVVALQPPRSAARSNAMMVLALLRLSRASRIELRWQLLRGLGLPRFVDQSACSKREQFAKRGCARGRHAASRPLQRRRRWSPEAACSMTARTLRPRPYCPSRHTGTPAVCDSAVYICKTFRAIRGLGLHS